MNAKNSLLAMVSFLAIATSVSAGALPDCPERMCLDPEVLPEIRHICLYGPDAKAVLRLRTGEACYCRCNRLPREWSLENVTDAIPNGEMNLLSE